MNVKASGFERMTSICGVTIELRRGDRVIPVETSGELTSVAKGPIDVTLTVDPKMNMLGYFIRPDKTHEILPVEKSSNGNVYRRSIEMLETNNRGTKLVYPDPKTANGLLRLLHVTGDGGAIMWAISLVAQRGITFVVVQQMFAEQFYIDENGSARSPEVEKVQKWKSTVDLVQWWLGQNPVQLPPLSSYQPTPVEEPKIESDSLTGVVDWYAEGMGMGAVKTATGTVMVKHDQVMTLRGRDPLRYLIAGEKVRAKIRQKTKGGAFAEEFLGVEVTGREMAPEKPPIALNPVLS